MTKEELFEKIEKYLNEYKETIDTGWPVVTDEEIWSLNNIIYELIKLKYEGDTDRDLPIDFCTVDRTKYYHHYLSFAQCRYPKKIKTLKEAMDELRVRVSNLTTAENDLSIYSKYLDGVISQDKKLSELRLNQD